MYAYNVLPRDGSIRLFVLEPGTGEQPLRGSLSTCRLDEAPYFEAISYVWGAPDRCIELICDGQQIFITVSLSDVLHRVRLPDRSRTLWTDSVCINQEDLDEKGSQVSFMGSIYRRADRTLIRVGEDDEGHGAPLLGLLNDVERSVFANLSDEWDSAPFTNNDQPMACDSRWQSVRHLLNTPWFLRGWTIQEAAHARHGVVLWGKHEFSWTLLMRTVTWAFRRVGVSMSQNMDEELPELHMSCFSLSNKEVVQPFMPEAFWGNVGNVLSTFHSGRKHNFTDQRDRIYALYDLPSSGRSENLQIVPNYHKSFPDVCRDLALNYLDVYDDLDLLLFVMHDEESLRGDLPSWIPLWGATNVPYGRESFRSSYATSEPPLIEKYPKKLSFRGENHDLPVSGLRFSKVLAVSAVLTKEMLTFEGVAALWSKACCAQETKIPEDSDCFTTFLAVLRCGYSTGQGRSIMRYQDEAAFTIEISKIATGQAKLSIDPIPSEEQATGGDAQGVLSSIQRTAQDKRFVVTDRGYGIASYLAQEDDECVVLRGGKMPFLLRKADGAGNYKLIGPMFHSSEFINVDEDARLCMGTILDADDFLLDDWSIEEEEFCLV